MAEGNTISGSGASAAPGASEASQAVGGSASQKNAVASTGMTEEQRKAIDDFNNYEKFQYKEENTKKAVKAIKERESGISKEEPEVHEEKVHISKELSDELKSSNGTVSIQRNAGTVSDVEDGVSRSKSVEISPFRQGLIDAGTIPVIGDYAISLETALYDPKTGDFSPNIQINPIYKAYKDKVRIKDWEEVEGSEKFEQRKQAGYTVLTDIGVAVGTLGVGAAVGAGVKGLSVGLSKVQQSSKIGNTVVSLATNPVIKVSENSGKFAQAISKASSPANIGLNSVTAYSVVDLGKTVASDYIESTAKGTTTLVKSVASLPLAIAGGGLGYKTASKIEGEIKTKGLTYLPTEKYTVEGIPLSNKLNQDNLQVSFEKNIFYPKPDKIAETDKVVQDVSSSAKLPAHPNQETVADFQIYHATNKPFGKEFEVAESQSEIKNLMYGAPKAETYFTRISAETEVMPGLFFDLHPSSGGEILNIKGTAVKKIDYKVAARDLNIPEEKLMQSRNLQYKAADYYVSKYGKNGEFYIPAIKAEYEAGPKAGTKYRRLPSRFYTDVHGVKVKISEYEPVLTDSPSLPKTQSQKSIKNYYSSEYSVGYYPGFYSKLNSSVRSRRNRIYESSVFSENGGYSASSTRSSSSRHSGISNTGSSISAKTSALSSIIYGGKSSRTGVSSVLNNGARLTNPIRTSKKKKEDKKGYDKDYYKAAKRGRIDHLSLVDPLEFLGRGSLTNRNRADVTMYKKTIYLVDNEVSIVKPKGRIRVMK